MTALRGILPLCVCLLLTAIAHAADADLETLRQKLREQERKLEALLNNPDASKRPKIEEKVSVEDLKGHVSCFGGVRERDPAPESLFTNNPVPPEWQKSRLSPWPAVSPLPSPFGETWWKQYAEKQ